jgi:hypothetical protein
MLQSINGKPLVYLVGLLSIMKLYCHVSSQREEVGHKTSAYVSIMHIMLLCYYHFIDDQKCIANKY